MKTIIVSDTHKEAKNIQAVRDFALQNGIDTVIDAGDLHGCIEAYKGVKLHATYWQEASGAMGRWEFMDGVRSIGGDAHETGSTFSLDDTLVFTQHDLAEYEPEISAEAWEKVKIALEEGKRKLAVYGHTHQFQFKRKNGITAVNPGSISIGDPGTFVVYDLETGDLELRTLSGTLLKINSQENNDIVQVRDFSAFSNEFIATLEQGEVYVIKGKRSKVFNKIVAHTMKDFEEHCLENMLLAVEKENGKCVVDQNGKETKEYDRIFSFDSYYIDKNTSEVIFRAEKNGKKIFAGLDGKETSKGYDELCDIVTRAGELYFIAKEGEEQVLVKGWNCEEIARGKEIEGYRIKFHNGKACATVKTANNKYAIAYDGKTTKEFDFIHCIAVDSGNIAYSAISGSDNVLMLNDAEVERVPCKGYTAVISAVSFVDGKAAYAVARNGRQHVMIDQTDTGLSFEAKGYGNGVSQIGRINGSIAVVVMENYAESTHCNGKVSKGNKLKEE